MSGSRGLEKRLRLISPRYIMKHKSRIVAESIRAPKTNRLVAKSINLTETPLLIVNSSKKMPFLIRKEGIQEL